MFSDTVETLLTRYAKLALFLKREADAQTLFEPILTPNTPLTPLNT